MSILNAGAQFGLVSWTLSGLVAFGSSPGPTPGPTLGPADRPAAQQPSSAAVAAVAEDEEARAAFDALVEALEADRQNFEKASREWYEANRLDERTASEEAQREFNDKFRAWWNEHEPSPRYVARFEALATQHRGSEIALDCWLRVIELDAGAPLDDGASAETSAETSKGRPLAKALTALLGEHLKSEKLEAFCIGLQYGTALPHATVVDAMTKIRAGSPHRKVQAAATFALAGELAGERGGEAGKSAARALYAQLAADFADVSMPNGKSYRRIADGNLFELDHLQVGKLAPDFEAIDETGARFKLSDYRGKVVMLDFWGFW